MMKQFDPKAQPAKLEVLRLDELDDGEFTAPEPDELDDEDEDDEEEEDDDEGDEAAGDEGIDDVHASR